MFFQMTSSISAVLSHLTARSCCYRGASLATRLPYWFLNLVNNFSCSQVTSRIAHQSHRLWEGQGTEPAISPSQSTSCCSFKGMRRSRFRKAFDFHVATTESCHWFKDTSADRTSTNNKLCSFKTRRRSATMHAVFKILCLLLSNTCWAV